jgi:hypothetical protein
VPPAPITTAAALDRVIVDRLRVRVIRGGTVKGRALPTRALRLMVGAELFLQQFKPVDVVETASRYLPDFSLTRPGYNDGGYGQRILHIGGAPRVEPDPEAINRFLDVMAFATVADRSNAVAAALTVRLRNHWLGGKPCIVVTSNKSHAGKDTVVSFAAGTAHQTAISYERTDWAVQKALVAALKHDRELGLVVVENARLDGGQREISSAIMERLLTNPEPLLFSPGTGDPVRRPNDFVIAITTNHGTLSEDLHNRGLPIHLEAVGDVAARQSPIGNPRVEYLPAQCERIDAELLGLVERWKAEGRPLDTSVRHPFGAWAATVGGILMVGGFDQFLANYASRTTADDPVRRGLALLGAARPDEWLRPREWAELARERGLVKAVIPAADRDNDLARERGAGVVLSAHAQETFTVATDDERLVLRLEKARRRLDAGGEPHTCYRFTVVSREEVPED